MKDENKTQKVLNIINDFKSQNEWGNNCEAGYHSIALDGKRFKGKRDNLKRIGITGDNFFM